MTDRVIRHHGAVTLHTSLVAEDVLYVNISVADGDADVARQCRDAYGPALEQLKQHGMEIVHERVFGSLAVRNQVLAARSEAMRERSLDDGVPVTYVQGQPLCSEGLAGISIQAVRPRAAEDIWTIVEGGVPRGRGWKRGGATFLMLQDLHGFLEGPGQDNARQGQVIRMFDRADRILREQGAQYGDVVRTWLYVSDILDWYGELNAARNARYRDLGLLPDPAAGPGAGRLPPASTGIRGENPYGAACVMDLIALGGESDSRPEVVPVSSRRQLDAFEYGSAFSRAMCVREPDLVHIHISGTAAIDEQGGSLFPGDCRAQVLRTIDTVEALIAQQGASLDDICEATIFLKRAEDAGVLREAIQARGLEEMPAIYVVADVCRDDLLFEMDGTAAFRPR